MGFLQPCASTGGLQWKRPVSPIRTGMSLGRALVWLLVMLALLFPGCENEKKDPYSGLSRIVAERNEARRVISDQKAREKGGAPKANRSTTQSSAAGKKNVSSGSSLSERQVLIVDAVSGNRIAKGVAYLNENGKIVRIKILKN